MIGQCLIPKAFEPLENLLQSCPLQQLCCILNLPPAACVGIYIQMRMRQEQPLKHPVGRRRSSLSRTTSKPWTWCQCHPLAPRSLARQPGFSVNRLVAERVTHCPFDLYEVPFGAVLRSGFFAACVTTRADNVGCATVSMRVCMILAFSLVNVCGLLPELFLQSE